MKVWLMAGLSIVMAQVAVYAASPDTQTVKDADGKPLATVVVCSDCESPGGGAKKQCRSGVENGWLDGQPCGKCMLNANYEWHYQSTNGLYFTGTLTDAGDKPVKDRYVKMFIANGWGVRGRTAEDGRFQLTIGATEQPRAKKPLLVDLGARIDLPNSDPKSSYTVYLLPPSYKPCSAQPTPAPAKGHDGKKKH